MEWLNTEIDWLWVLRETIIGKLTNILKIFRQKHLMDSSELKNIHHFFGWGIKSYMQQFHRLKGEEQFHRLKGEGAL